MIEGVGFMKGYVPNQDESFYSATDHATGEIDTTKVRGERSFMVLHLPVDDRSKANYDLCAMVDPQTGDMRLLAAREYYREGHQDQLPNRLTSTDQVVKFFNHTSSDASKPFIAPSMYDRSYSVNLVEHPEIYDRARSTLSNLRDNLVQQHIKANQPIL